MLRFGVNNSPRRKGPFGGERLRLWALVITLGLVVVAIRHLGKPQTADNLGRLFLEQPPTTENIEPVKPSRSLQTSPNLAERELIDSHSAKPPVSHGELGDLSQVEDNTYFRPQEREPWFALFDRLQQTTASELAEETFGTLSYAQLLQQPDEYRGRVITLRGIVVRAEGQHPEKNKLGITSYFRLWIRPEGGGQWPFVVYCLELPHDFPMGDNLRAEIEATGIFFKNWSYPYENAMGIAPVVLAKSFLWHQPTIGAKRKKITRRGMVWGMIGAAFLAGVVVWLALQYTRRSPHIAPNSSSPFVPPEPPREKGIPLSLQKSAASEKGKA